MIQYTNAGQTAQDTNIATNATDITTNASAIALNTAKVSFPSASSTKLDGIETGADVTDTTNVWSSSRNISEFWFYRTVPYSDVEYLSTHQKLL